MQAPKDRQCSSRLTRKSTATLGINKGNQHRPASTALQVSLGHLDMPLPQIPAWQHHCQGLLPRWREGSLPTNRSLLFSNSRLFSNNRPTSSSLFISLPTRPKQTVTLSVNRTRGILPALHQLQHLCQLAPVEVTQHQGTPPTNTPLSNNPCTFSNNNISLSNNPCTLPSNNTPLSNTPLSNTPLSNTPCSLLHNTIPFSNNTPLNMDKCNLRSSITLSNSGDLSRARPGTLQVLDPHRRSQGLMSMPPKDPKLLQLNRERDIRRRSTERTSTHTSHLRLRGQASNRTLGLPLCQSLQHTLARPLTSHRPPGSSLTRLNGTRRANSEHGP
ncbi:hypothetical protein N658DRAFT_510285 [Parathielavia hyrcaniae]|uniref:Uncharacterized protein n=1 Tax=Parathielavia hyrcaniae TaxID=113614 RepID=A0AAN6PTB4_9PEZI|nr:hypothetical protein N658DRAFT_510285 [Parathielavia hyrcaniae]